MQIQTNTCTVVQDITKNLGESKRCCHTLVSILLFVSFPNIFSARCNIYISRLCYDVSVRLSVLLSLTEVHWRIIANLGFKFRSKFNAHCGHEEG